MIIISNKAFVKLITFNVANAITIFPFIFLIDSKLKKNKILLNHERIHIRQQLELLIIPFYIWYLIQFLIKLAKYKSRNIAYLNISFEKEAYQNEHNFSYLKSKKIYSFLKYL